MNKLLSRGALSALVTAILATPVMAEPLPEDAAVQLLRKLDDLQTDVSKLRGENEKLRHDLDKLKKNQRDNFQQMDERMDKLKDQAATKPADSSGSSTSTTTNSGSSSSSSTSNTTTTANTNAGISSSSTSSNPTTTILTNSENKPSDSTTKVADIKPSTPPSSNDTKDSGKKDDPNGFYSYGTGKTDDPNPAKPKDEKTDSAQKPDETKPADSGSSVTNKSERSAYEDAFNTLLKSPKEAVPAFRSFLKTYPNSALAASAQYWIGEALYAEKDFKGAVEEFLVVLKEYKGSDKAPDAALKLGYSFYELKDWEKARKTLEDVISFFPNSKENAAKAKDRLDKMTAEGH